MWLHDTQPGVGDLYPRGKDLTLISSLLSARELEKDRHRAESFGRRRRWDTEKVHQDWERDGSHRSKRSDYVRNRTIPDPAVLYAAAPDLVFALEHGCSSLGGHGRP